MIPEIYPGEIKYQKGKSSSKNCSLLSGEPVGKSAQSHQRPVQLQTKKFSEKPS